MLGLGCLQAGESAVLSEYDIEYIATNTAMAKEQVQVSSQTWISVY